MGDEMRKVIVQKWKELERGWGSRPDGYSLHLTDADRQTFIQEYWDTMPSDVPDEYSAPDGRPYPVEMNDEIYEQVRVSKNGIRFSGDPPGSGGTDGWIPIHQGD